MTTSTATLTTLRDRVEQMLLDTGNAIWTTGLLEEAVRQALHEYSNARMLKAIATLTLSSDTRELDISSISGLLEIERVWLPYDSSDPEHPPNWRNFEHWRDDQILFFPDANEPQSADVARIFHAKLQTLNGLDSETTTSFPIEDESLLVTGGAGFAAISRSVDVAEQVTLDRNTGSVLEAWGKFRLKDFRDGLARIAMIDALRESAHVDLPPLDRFDRDGRGWS